jgi:hypothetical protein
MRGSDATCHQRAVGEFAAAHRDVNALLDEIDKAVVEFEIDFEGRVLTHKSLNRGHQNAQPVTNR